jgi:hypothetical protein
MKRICVVSSFKFQVASFVSAENFGRAKDAKVAKKISAFVFLRGLRATHFPRIDLNASDG